MELARRFGKLLLIDATYKTNVYDMPLLQIVAMSCVGRLFTVAVCFMKRETFEEYSWALKCLDEEIGDFLKPDCIITDCDAGLMKAVREVFPSAVNYICAWHIRQNVEANCRGSFKSADDFDVFMRRWDGLVEEEELEGFDLKWKNIREDPVVSKRVCEYIQGQWLPKKQHFIAAFHRPCFDLGYHCTSGVEGMHACLKRSLGSSAGSVFTCVRRIDGFLRTQMEEIDNEFSADEVKRITETGSALLFSKLWGVVSRHCVRKIMSTLAEERRLPSSCTGSCYLRMGFPCAHQLLKMVCVPCGYLTLENW